jgi:hypothetical protein
LKRAAPLIICVAAGALHLHAAVADPAPLRVHGVVKVFDGQYLTVSVDSGKTMVLGLEPATRIVRSRMMTLSDIKPGFFVGTTAMKSADGTLHAQAIRIFPPASQGMGEGQYPMDSNPSRIVTNASVSAVTTNPTGGILSLTFHGAGGAPDCTGHAPAGGGGCNGNAQLLVARGVPIVAIAAGDTSMLVRGAIVSAYATSDVTSLFTATSITVERDGKPASVLAQ